VILCLGIIQKILDLGKRPLLLDFVILKWYSEGSFAKIFDIYQGG
jgi:hypothetical protein